ncbi:hypothetical protein [Streptomyces sp. HUAS ZL42]|uniref:hypothetical protein n=1 Tax=Streptomyces sp. HUAS ZL42 TaxID=3231715 RepID=UPI00345E752E
MTRLRWGLALSGWLALAATALPAAGVLRVLVTTVFLLVCPGLAAVRWAWPAPARAAGRVALLEAAVLTFVLSLSLAVVIAEALFLSGVFTVARALLALAVVTSTLALLPRPGAPRRSPGDSPGAGPQTPAAHTSE